MDQHDGCPKCDAKFRDVTRPARGAAVRGGGAANGEGENEDDCVFEDVRRSDTSWQVGAGALDIREALALVEPAAAPTKPRKKPKPPKA